MSDLKEEWIKQFGNSIQPSPFQIYADSEGFILEYVARSYKILNAINNSIPNYYILAEDQAKRSPNMAEELYQNLRDGMDLSPEEFAQVHCLSFADGSSLRLSLRPQ